jgi:hypothetical protein
MNPVVPTRVGRTSWSVLKRQSQRLLRTDSEVRATSARDDRIVASIKVLISLREMLFHLAERDEYVKAHHFFPFADLASTKYHATSLRMVSAA